MHRWGNNVEKADWLFKNAFLNTLFWYYFSIFRCYPREKCLSDSWNSGAAQVGWRERFRLMDSGCRITNMFPTTYSLEIKKCVHVYTACVQMQLRVSLKYIRNFASTINSYVSRYFSICRFGLWCIWLKMRFASVRGRFNDRFPTEKHVTEVILNAFLWTTYHSSKSIVYLLLNTNCPHCVQRPTHYQKRSSPLFSPQIIQ